MPNETEQRLREIEERVSKATPGPWYAKATDDASFMNARYVSTRPGPFEHDNRRGMDPTAPDHDASHVVAITLLQTPLLADVADAKWDENTEFIAHAREDVPWLLSLLRERDEEIRRLRQQMGSLEQAVEEVRKEVASWPIALLRWGGNEALKMLLVRLGLSPLLSKEDERG